MEYEELDREDFDAIVTGELTHLAIYMEEELNKIICDYFGSASSRRKGFQRLFLYRDGLSFQDKIDIVRGMLPLFGEHAEHVKLKNLLSEVEDFKRWRNAMAHGFDVSEEPGPELHVEIVTRSGKEKVIVITPASHRETMAAAGKLFDRLGSTRVYLREQCGVE